MAKVRFRQGWWTREGQTERPQMDRRRSRARQQRVGGGRGNEHRDRELVRKLTEATDLVLRGLSRL